jgi:hypothetical protein
VPDVCSKVKARYPIFQALIGNDNNQIWKRTGVCRARAMEQRAGGMRIGEKPRVFKDLRDIGKSAGLKSFDRTLEHQVRNKRLSQKE